MGRNVGRSVTDTRGNTTFYDSMGRNTGRSATDSRGNTTFYDLVRSQHRALEYQWQRTTIYDSMGRQTGTIRR